MSVRIVTYPGGRTNSDWCVVADWHGAPRVVKRGTVFECCAYARAIEAVSPSRKS